MVSADLYYLKVKGLLPWTTGSHWPDETPTEWVAIRRTRGGTPRDPADEAFTCRADAEAVGEHLLELGAESFALQTVQAGELMPACSDLFPWNKGETQDGILFAYFSAFEESPRWPFATGPVKLYQRGMPLTPGVGYFARGARN